MAFSAEWLALQREAQLAGEQIAVGVTVLGRANHAQTGLYAQALFGLSIGLERLGKLIVIADHAIESNGQFPTDTHLRRVGHDLSKLFPRCEKIGKRLDSNRAYAPRPVDPIHQGIERALSEFATTSRYYNLNHIAGAAGQQTDPIALWWEIVAKPICDRHYSARQRAIGNAMASAMASALGDRTMVLSHTEDGSEINTVDALVTRGNVTATVQKYGRLYSLQIVRWLASILAELSHHGAYAMRIEPLLGLNEHFAIFCMDDAYLRDRKTWSIYSP